MAEKFTAYSPTIMPLVYNSDGQVNEEVRNICMEGR